MEAASKDDSTSLQRVQAATLRGVRLTLYEAARSVSVYYPLLLLLWAFDLIQMLTLALAPVRVKSCEPRLWL